MGLMRNWIRYIHRNISSIWTHKNWVWWNVWIRMRWNVVISMLWHDWMRVWLNSWIRIIRVILMLILSLHTPWNRLLRENWEGNVYFTMVTWINLDGMIPMYTSVMTVTIKTILSTNITWTMVGRRDVLRPISNSTITINTFSNIEQGRLAYPLRNNSMSWTITPTIYSLGGIMAGLGHIYNYTIATNSFSYIVRRKVDVLFRPRSISTIINSDITLLFFMILLLYRTWR